MEKNKEKEKKFILSTPKSKREKNLQILIHTFKTNDCLSINDICQLLNCNRQSAYNYIHFLEKNNYSVLSNKEGRQAIYSISFADSNTSMNEYRPLTADILRKYCIMQALQEHPCNKSTFKNEFTLQTTFQKKQTQCNGIPVNYDGKIPIDIGVTQFYKLLHQLIDSGEITLDPNTNMYSLSGQTIPLVWSINYDTLFDTFNELSNVPPASAYYEQLQSIYCKLGVLVGDIDETASTFQNYLLYGKQHIAFQDIASQINKLNPYDYQHKYITVHYTTRKKAVCSVLFATGLIVYCVEKDTVYLIGEKYSPHPDDDSSKYIIINLTDITQIEKSDIVNPYFHSSEYLKIFDEMFSISTDPAVQVKVAFDCIGNIERKIKYLSKQRKHSSISYNEEQSRIIYTDYIRGLSDFAAYLRQFGRSAHIIEPTELKEKMAFSINRSLERYNEVSL